VIRAALWLAVALSLLDFRFARAVCEGQGTQVFFGNGMLNSKDLAELSLRQLEASARRMGVVAREGQPIQFRLAYKRSEPILEQLARVALQKGLSDFEGYWLWVASLQKAPDWFTDAARLRVQASVRATNDVFEGVRTHFEDYSRSLRAGFNVVLVSHSQGNLYANRVMQGLPDYVDSSLSGSVKDRGKGNPLFPSFEELFANIQVATPVSATVDGTPWLTFPDDLVMRWVRDAVGALPSNLRGPGMGLPPEGDFLGHSFVKAYLRSAESEQTLFRHLRAAIERLRFPIPDKRSGFLVEFLARPTDPQREALFFSIRDATGRSVGEVDERYPRPGEVIHQGLMDCLRLKPGIYRVRAETHVAHSASAVYPVVFWPDGGVDLKGEKSVERRIHAKRGVQRWELAVLRVLEGKGAHPLGVETEIHARPLPLP
jgi:hypothetical protein